MSEENRTLNRLLKRQNRALQRLVGDQGELPTLLRAHNEETRALKHHLKKANKENRSLEAVIKQKNEQVLSSS